jgi:pyrimidine deaminase RibD-like protein
VIRNEELERFILGFALEIQHDGFGRQTSIAALQVAASAKCGNTGKEELLDALHNLKPDHAELTKFVNLESGFSQPVKFEPSRRKANWHDFFMTGSFNIKVLPAGRVQFQQLSEPTLADADFKFARLAIDEARKSVPEDDGRPHPWVGAVVVKNGKVLSTAHRGEVPGNHAEFIALERNIPDAAAAGATVYATLEPCTTRNRPKIPCADRLIERKIRRVVIGMLDPDGRIRGKGHRKLSNAGIEIDFFPHQLRMEIEEINREFTRYCEQQPEASEGRQNSDNIWMKLFKEKQRLEEEVAALETQIPNMRVIPAIKLGKDEVDLLREKIQRKKSQIQEIQERMKRLT